MSQHFTRGIAAGVAVALAGWAAAQTQTNQVALLALSQEFAQRALAERQFAEAWASLTGEPVRVEYSDGTVIELIRIERGMPVYLTTLNLMAAQSVSTDRVWPGGVEGLSLDGAGVTLGIWDGGNVRATHQEFAGGRVTRVDNGSLSDHATHVGGTMAAAGVRADAKGMSFAALLRSWDWNNDDSEMATAAGQGLRVSNHSYGTVAGWQSGSPWRWYGDVSLSQTTDWQFGFYDSGARAWDQIAYNAPFYLIVKSAGNDRGSAPASQPSGQFWNGTAWVSNTVVRDRDGGTQGYDCIPRDGNAKNILTVAAVNDVPGGYSGPGSVAMSSFSSWGPTDDGRIKPDISANGVGLVSSVSTSDTAYATYSGTSMSSPNASGSLGLLAQHYRATHAGQDMRAATLKGLVIHTADEAGANPGPDYAFGWGLMNTAKAARAISQDVGMTDTISELSLSNGQRHEFTVYADGTRPLRATVSWTDPAGTPPAASLNPRTRMLVNDLDLRIIAGSTTHLPWTLDVLNPAAPAVPGDNIVDNVEQIQIDSPAPGFYTVRVSHKGTTLAPSGSQAFSLVVTGQTAAPPIGVDSVVMNPGTILTGATSTGTVTLASDAPTTGINLTLSTDQPGAVTLPGTVNVPGGQRTGTFTATGRVVSISTSATITATLGANSASAPLTVNPVRVAQLSLSPTSLQGGARSTATVTLEVPAPTGGLRVSLFSNHTAATVPVDVLVPGGSQSATFLVSTQAVASRVTATVRATLGANERTSNLTVLPVPLTSVTVTPVSVLGGVSATGRVTLGGKAPPDGLTVKLRSNLSDARVPATVKVPGGASSVTFPVTTVPVSAQKRAILSAISNGVTRTATLDLLPPRPASLVVTPTTLIGGGIAQGLLTLTADAPSGGAVVSLDSSDTTAATVPATVTVRAGARTATFDVRTRSVRAVTRVTVTASYNSASAHGSVTVNPITVARFDFDPAVIYGGQRTQGLIELTAPAPAGGLRVALRSGNSSLLPVPPSVVVPAGNTIVSFVVTSAGVTRTSTVTVTATLHGVNRTARVTLNPVQLASLRISPSFVTGGDTASGTVTLIAPAPAGGLVVTIRSSSTLATAPTTVTVPAGRTSASFTVTTRRVTAAQRVTFRALYNSIERSATLDLRP